MKMDNNEHAIGLAEKMDFSDWEWGTEELTKPVSEAAACIVMMELIKGKAFVTWEGDKIVVKMGPLVFQFIKSDLELIEDHDTPGSRHGKIKIELGEMWQ